MLYVLLITMPIAGGLLYGNLVTQMRKIRDRKDTINHTGWGVVLSAYLVPGFIFLILGSSPS